MGEATKQNVSLYCSEPSDRLTNFLIHLEEERLGKTFTIVREPRALHQATIRAESVTAASVIVNEWNEYFRCYYPKTVAPSPLVTPAIEEAEPAPPRP